MKKVLSTAFGVAVLLALPASAVNITISDYNAGVGFNGGPYGVGREDNETEPGTTQSQAWDLEAFSIVGTKLYLVGGYDFERGLSGGLPGDLFIKVGGAAGYKPTWNTGSVKNGDYYNYDYAVLLSGSLAGETIGVESLNANSKLKTVDNDNLKSNPWKYDSAGTDFQQTEIDYSTGLTANQVELLAGVGSLMGDAGLNGNNKHNVISIDLGFLGTITPGTEVYVSYTMECGNDSIKGSYDGGFRHDVPDGGVTLALLGMGLGTLGFVRRKLGAA